MPEEDPPKQQRSSSSPPVTNHNDSFGMADLDLSELSNPLNEMLATLQGGNQPINNNNNPLIPISPALQQLLQATGGDQETTGGADEEEEQEEGDPLGMDDLGEDEVAALNAEMDRINAVLDSFDKQNDQLTEKIMDLLRDQQQQQTPPATTTSDNQTLQDNQKDNQEQGNQ